MDYETTRVRAIRAMYKYLKNEALQHFDPDRKTIIFVPGGMASQLDRSEKPYDEMSPIWDGDPVWLDWGLLFERDALTLEMDSQRRDKGLHIIVPNRELRTGIKAYDDTQAYFETMGYNYLVFGYDWRRSIDESADFLRWFLNEFRSSVMRRFNTRKDPLRTTTLMCHSQGGMVAKQFIEQVPNPLDWYEQVVTVGTGFYGVTNHQARYFEGMFPLSWLHTHKRVAKIISTMPGPYALMPLPKASFDAHHDRLGLAENQYPVVNAVTGEPADPYDPENLHLFPKWMNRHYLAEANELLRSIAEPLEADVAARFFNLRSVNHADTATHQAWKDTPDDYDPWKDDSPVATLSTDGHGDSVVPWWSAWHASTPDSNRVDLKEVAKHMDIAEAPETLAIVKGIVDNNTVPDADQIESDKVMRDKIEPMAREEFEKLIQEVKKVREGKLLSLDFRMLAGELTDAEYRHRAVLRLRHELQM